MGEKDIAEKTLESYNDVFADLINVTIFNGRQVNKVEVQNIMYILFDQERINELNRLDAEKKLNKLNALLAAAGRMDELVKSFTDKTLQNKLLQEYSAQLV